jgi:hypothetical protein
MKSFPLIVRRLLRSVRTRDQTIEYRCTAGALHRPSLGAIRWIRIQSAKRSKLGQDSTGVDILAEQGFGLRAERRLGPCWRGPAP